MLSFFSGVDRLTFEHNHAALLLAMNVIGAFCRGWIIVDIEGKIMIIDQHAAHERIRLEYLLSLAEGRQMLEHLKDSQVFALDSLDMTLLHSSSSPCLDTFNSRACHGAVKITDATSPEFQQELIEALFKCRYPYICAHGRPTMAQLSLI